jgi:photosystem II stability/assembly factor-like uncharacterized protein
MRTRVARSALLGLVLLAGTALVLPGLLRSQAAPADPVKAFSGLKYREIGPAIMGGRVDEFAVVESDPKIVYVGLASGGVWKTTNAGTTWTPIFDEQPVSSIGAVALAPSNPSIVWVGTGEANNRQSSSWGNGIYKSVDAGKTFKPMGLPESHHIGRIVIHPTNPDIVYAAALGRLWGPNKERGLYKTTDGGATWKNILFVNEDTGVTDVVMDRKAPDTLYAATYQRRRSLYGYNGGGPGSAIHKSTDGGATWTKLVRGLPYEKPEDGDTGRIGLSLYRKDSAIVYAIVEHANGGVFRSGDRGETWTRMSDVNPRPAYYSQIQVDPNNDKNVWVLGSPVYYSEDGGKTFDSRRVGRIHVDFHAVWIDPADSNHMLLGSDGGITWSWDAGKTWEFVNTIAIGQFYEVAYDFQKPYRISGGLQDNGSWIGPSISLLKWGQWAPAGSTNSDWFEVDGSDGYYTVIDPVDPNTVYAETPDGNPLRRDLRTNEAKAIRPREAPGDPRYRFYWDTPIVISTFDHRTIYYGAQYLFRSTDRGDSWAKISPDLTSNVNQHSLPTMGKLPDAKMISRQDGVWNWPTITSIAESSLNPSVLWVGTDDGNIQVTRDLGKTWQNVTAKLPGLPKMTCVARIIASRHAEGTAYVVLDNHRLNDFEPYLYTTADYGQTWRKITEGLPRNNGATRALREHHRNPDLLFAGTEFGAFVSFDRGAHWAPLRLNLPTVPVADIAIHPRENDLILATHGRSFWILDDITPFEQMNDRVRSSDLHLFDIRPATSWRVYDYRNDHGGPGHKFFIGENPPYGAPINYYLKSQPGPSDKVLVAVEDARGNKVREFEGTKDAGVNRVTWDLRSGPLSEVPAALRADMPGGGGGQRGFGNRGPVVDPGTYSVTVSLGSVKMKKTLVVEDDPRVEIPSEARAARWAALIRVGELTTLSGKLQLTTTGLTASLKGLQESWAKPGAPKISDALKKAVGETAKRVGEIHGLFVQPRVPLWLGSSSPPIVYPPVTFQQRILRVGSAIENVTAVPAAADLVEIGAIATALKEAGAAIDRLVSVDLPALNKSLAAAGLPAVSWPGR